MASTGGDGVSASRLANLVAPTIVAAFEAYEAEFQALTRRARGRFDRREWRSALEDSTERLDLYGEVIGRLEEEVRAQLDSRVSERLVWAGMKAVYSGMIGGRQDWDLAETFFNSLTRRIFATEGVDQNIEYVDSDFDPPRAQEQQLLVRSYERPDLESLIEALLSDGWVKSAFDDVRRDAAQTASLLRGQLQGLGIAEQDVTGAEILAAPFFRRKGAYLVGRLCTVKASPPLVLALLNTEAGVVVDAVLTDVEDVSILFSFTRSHFHVDLGPAHALVSYLRRLLPRKPVAELYIALGYHKHGKTLLYRDLLWRLAQTDERFEQAPGTPGMVMLVFTMREYDVVFKVIRDHFPAVKPTTPTAVRSNYRLVFRHDRAGRLVEAQEFEHLKFDRDRFAPDLLGDPEPL